jgi:hypothetical protein
MADDVFIDEGSTTTGRSIAADEISTSLYQRVKIALGADGTANDAVAGAGAVGTGVQRVTLASDDPAVVDLDKGFSGQWEYVSSTSQTALGPTGAVGDFLSHIVVSPQTTSPGTVTLSDGTGGTAMTLFAGGVSNTVPFTINIGAVSASSAWQITLGSTATTVIAVGKFTT